MMDFHLRKWELLHEEFKLCPGNRSLLASTINPFEENSRGLEHKPIDAFGVERNSKVAPMTCKFGDEDTP